MTIPVKIDLHTHSNASDGLLQPAELVVEASRQGICALALTDHDTLAGLPGAITAAESFGIELIPGVELSAEDGPNDVHILGYYVRPEDHILSSVLADFANERLERSIRVVERLGTLGLPIDFARVEQLAVGGTIGRPHIARAMIEAGFVDSVSDAFNRFLANGKPAFVPRKKTPPEQSVTLLRNAGAVPVLAHPFSTGDIDAILRRLVPLGLLGFEVYYGEYTAEQRLILLEIARDWSLIPTGGSDYHGPKFKEGRELGSVSVPEDSLIRLRQTWESLPVQQS